MTPKQVILLDHISKKRAFRYDDLHQGSDAVRTGPRFAAPIMPLANEMRVLWLRGLVELSVEPTLFGDRRVYMWAITDEGKDMLADGKEVFPDEVAVSARQQKR